MTKYADEKQNSEDYNYMSPAYTHHHLINSILLEILKKMKMMKKKVRLCFE